MIPQRLILQIKNTFEHSADGIYIKDKNFQYSYVNQAALINLKLQEDEVIHQTDSEMHFSKYAEHYNTHDLAALDDNIYYQLDTIFTKTGTLLFSLSQKFPLKDELNNTHGVLGITQYLTSEQVTDEALSKKSALGNKLKVTADIKSLLFVSQSDLSYREMEVLYYFLQGMSAKTTSSMLDISERTVIFHLHNIKDKWECNSKEAIFKKAVEKGLLKRSILWSLISKE